MEAINTEKFKRVYTYTNIFFLFPFFGTEEN